ncbi:MerR family transcriptional regulator [Pseudomaricurvus sp.]|uniref:MerR family transcriptional regulator n=1 Tax=Pseudomaricurvus sp. TaxID=2004510 RepID=UPI003F6C074B
MEKTPANDVETFPIRVLSEKTQVNTVTLRAWERRYGLLKPMRTDKGHRCYTNDDVTRVREILTWIHRGVSVGKVKGLLDAELREENPIEAGVATDLQTPEVEPHWNKLVDSLTEAVEQLNTGRVQHLLQDVFVQYPVELCVNHWLSAVMEKLQERRGGSALAASGAARALLQSELIRYALMRLEGHKSDNGKLALLIFGEHSEGWRLAMTGLQLADSGFGVCFINQPCSIVAALSLVTSSEADIAIVLQDGRFSQVDEEILSASFGDKNLYLCGSAGVLSSFSATGRVFKSTQELLKAAKFNGESLRDPAED